ncbi:MAG TPA: carboxypeptidase-like regulatory domain-containing protein [Terracidiphilus sp.]
MVAQSWTKSVAWTALLTLAGAVMAGRAPAQRPSGSLTGTLTDTYSSPLENVKVTLRNAATGAEIRTTTSRGGRYTFKDLDQGEYSLIAAGASGGGEVDGIAVSAGHESRVHAVIEFGKTEPVRADAHFRRQWVANKPAASVTGSHLLPDLVAHISAALPEFARPMADASLTPEPVAALPLSDLLLRPPELVPATTGPERALGSTGANLDLENDLPSVEFVQMELASLPASFLTGASETATPIAVMTASEGTDTETIDAAQMQALPLVNRDWTGFLLESSAAASTVEGQREPASVGAPIQANIDGVPGQSAFGNVNNSRRAALRGTTGESAIERVQIVDAVAGPLNGAGTASQINLQTQRGTEHTHGQIFVFDRQNLWDARNPFTQWTQETAPALGAAIPAFNAEPYSPTDRELLWGVGVGGVPSRSRLFWFGAFDGFARNDPGVATVKHPENFFAQPSDDNMQLLSAQLGLSSIDPVGEGVTAYSKLIESLAGLLGPAPRSSRQWTGFGRLDWSIAEHHRFTLEMNAAEVDSPGGGFTRASETYGNHSFGSMHATNDWMLGRWEAFINPNLLAVTQGSVGRQIQSALPERPSAFEQAMNINAWGQLPQIVVDSRYGFTIGNPARFGRGSYPDEHLYMGQEQLRWIRGNLLLESGFEISHNHDATSRLRNQTGTYYYSSVENFASDALGFLTYGLNGQLNPMEQHNCDQRGKAWRDASGTLHGLGYLPCYSYYSQTMGPADWWLSTNDWAGYVTSRWLLTKRTAFTLAMRWEREQLPPPIRTLNNPVLPLTERSPDLGNQWSPRAAFAWGSGESHWPVVRLGYGMYFSRTRNAVAESALTQTGSIKGDLNFFMRPTDNLYGGGAPPFPYVLAGEPASVVKPGATEFAPNFRNGEIHQAEASLEETLPGRIHLSGSAIASLGRRLPVTFDANIDPGTNPKTITYAVIDGNGTGPIKNPQITVPFFASWPSAISDTGFAGRLNPNYQQISEIFSRANSTYEALVMRLSRNAHAVAFHARYTYGHAMDCNPDETSQLSGPSVFDPIDFRQEYGTSSLDARHSATANVMVQPKWKLKDTAGRIANGWMLSGLGYFNSGLPFSMRTAGSLAKEFNVNGTAIVGLSSGMNGYGGDDRVYGVGRNTYRYPATWKADVRITKRFDLGQMRQLELMAESFNLFNHQNVTELETVGYSIESGTVNGTLPRLNYLTGLKTGQTEFGKPLNINATDLYRERQLQFGARLRF